MHRTVSQSLKKSLCVIAAATAFAACSKDAPTSTGPSPTDQAVATLRSATIRYAELDSAKADGFVFLHGCEVREDGRPVGTVYVNMSRLADGRIDPSKPDGLIYEPNGSAHPPLLAVELAIPYSLWTDNAPPKFLDTPFQREDEFGVFGLHIWVWEPNPKGLFAETNPDVSC